MTRPFSRTCLALAVAAGASVLACDTACCDRTACEATATPHAALTISQGLVGVVAYSNDLATDCGCFECDWSTLQLQLWRAPGAALDDDEADALIAQPPAMARAVGAFYELQLEHGHYLVCALGTCGFLDVQPGVVFTLNWLTSMGLARLTVFDATGVQRDDLVL